MPTSGPCVFQVLPTGIALEGTRMENMPLPCFLTARHWDGAINSYGWVSRPVFLFWRRPHRKTHHHPTVSTQAWCRAGHTAQQQQQQHHMHTSTSSSRRSRQPPCTAATATAQHGSKSYQEIGKASNSKHSRPAEAPKQQKTTRFQTVHMREAAPRP